MKKEYMQPAMLVVLMSTRQQMLAGSVTNVVTNLEPANPVVVTPTDPIDDPWDDAKSREMTFDDEEEDELDEN